MSDSIKTIAILGGTGDLGGGLARQWLYGAAYLWRDPKEGWFRAGW